MPDNIFEINGCPPQKDFLKFKKSIIKWCEDNEYYDEELPTFLIKDKFYDYILIEIFITLEQKLNHDEYAKDNYEIDLRDIILVPFVSNQFDIGSSSFTYNIDNQADDIDGKCIYKVKKPSIKKIIDFIYKNLKDDTDGKFMSLLNNTNFCNELEEN